MRMRVLGLMVGLVLLSACGARDDAVPQRPAGPPAANAAQVAAALRQGGLVLFFRHAATDHGRDDASKVRIEDCATQRVLSAAGQAQARAIGAGLARLRIPIGEVRASPYCRCADTARLAFDYVLLDDDLLPLRDGDAAAHLAAVRRLLSTPPIPGTNVALVGHGDTIEQLAGFELDEGEAAIARPAVGGGSFTLVGRIRADHWAAIAAAR